MQYYKLKRAITEGPSVSRGTPPADVRWFYAQLKELVAGSQQLTDAQRRHLLTLVHDVQLIKLSPAVSLSRRERAVEQAATQLKKMRI